MANDRPSNWWENLTPRAVLPAVLTIAVLVGIGVFVTGEGSGTILAVGALAVLGVVLMGSMLFADRVVDWVAARLPWP